MATHILNNTSSKMSSQVLPQVRASDTAHHLDRIDIGSHIGAVPLTDFQDLPVGEHSNGFPHRVAAYLQHLSKFLLLGDALADFPGAPLDLVADQFDRRIDERSPWCLWECEAVIHRGSRTTETVAIRTSIVPTQPIYIG